MLEKILELLQSDTFYDQSELIEIAKGKHKLYTTGKEIKEQNNREKQWQSKKK